MSVARRAGLVTLLALAMAMATSSISILSVLAPFLTDDLRLSRSGIGLAITVVSGVGAVTALGAGTLADRLGGRTMSAIILGVGIFVFLATSRATSLLWIVGIAAICGFANGAANPATNKLVAAHFPQRGRGLVMGVKQSGVHAGLLVAGIALPPAALAFGWRTSLLIGAMVPILGLLALLRWVPPETSGGERRGDPAPGPYRASHMVRWMTIYGALMGAGAAAIVSFLPLYAEESLGLSVYAAGLAASTFGLLGVAGRVLWAHLTERLQTFTATLGLLAGLALIAALLMLAAPAVGPWLLWVGTVIAGSSVAAWNAVGMLAIVAREHGAEMGRASGRVNVGFLGGMSLAPTTFGWLVDHTGTYSIGWLLVACLLAAALLTAVAWHRTAPAAGSRPASSGA